MDTEIMLSRREATLRSAATATLTGIALVQAIQLPSLSQQGRQFAFLSVAAIALCIALGSLLAASPARAAHTLWRLVAGTAVLVLAGWAAPRAFSIPGLDADQGQWTPVPGLPCAALAAVSLVLAAVAAKPRRSARSLVTGLVVLMAMAPGAGALVVSMGPAPVGGEAALVAGEHGHNHA